MFCVRHFFNNMGQTVSTGIDNDELIDNLVEADYIKNTKIQRIFRAVDRASYFLTEQKGDAYRDSAWRAGNLHLSAPCVYSGVMESLNLRPGLSFLNLGSGCGYLSTMAGLILGPYGMNHGVEIYTDVIDYAFDRLEDFIKQSEALDEYDFCEPTFVNGNCLKIDSVQLYDRVYCGAACPLEHETYMKHLIKVGGVLVMPLNNKLLQITRTSASTWESVMILSVSFAPLISPSDIEVVDLVQLPEFSPPSLQVLCRSKIRTILKLRIDEEHPSLQEKKIERCRNKIRRHVRRIVIPLIDESDSSDSGNDSDTNYMDFRSPNARITIGRCGPTHASAFIKSFLRARTEIQGVVAGPSNWNIASDPSTNSVTVINSGNSNKKTETSEELEQKQVKKDEEDEDSSESYSDVSSDEDTEIICSAALIGENELMANLTPSPPEQPPTSKKPCLRKRRHSGSNPGTSQGKKRVKSSPKKKLFRSRIASVICKRLPSTDHPAAKKKVAVNKTPETDAINYSSLMAKKILCLPLPMRVQMYINYRRNM